MDKTMEMMYYTKDEYIDWLMVDMGYSLEDAEEMAKVMGY